jgi:hypothetical protein
MIADWRLSAWTASAGGPATQQRSESAMDRAKTGVDSVLGWRP